MKSAYTFEMPQFDNGKTPTNTVYSDRLIQWDYERYNEMCKRHFGNHAQAFYDRAPEKIQAFLRDYMNNQNVVLCRVEELENKSTGYPYWRFDYCMDENES
ncbi:hypothetical protein E6Q11_05135 [Candidatus Dojkabacteria bacterium]|uniref:Uncharacterized protein n=1 Tax=Candidatus Dojkabacteria bacterium TaxID=2099670 RepID=A0A5C7J6P6_9BACT|nr:MAG: hypothetical protein E6Q11_05135 [Candidatus Dojkabacteria bacterium]